MVNDMKQLLFKLKEKYIEVQEAYIDSVETLNSSRSAFLRGQLYILKRIISKIEKKEAKL